jgi:hypothetical protein
MPKKQANPKAYLRKVKKAGKHARVEAEYTWEEALDRAEHAIEAMRSRFHQSTGLLHPHIEDTSAKANDLIKDLRSIDYQALVQNVRKDERVEQALHSLGNRMEDLASHMNTMSHTLREKAIDLDEETSKPSFIRKRLPLLVLISIGAGVVIGWATRKR